VITGDVSGDPDNRLGMQLGTGVRIPLLGPSGIDTEINYIQRGFTRSADDPESQAIGANGTTYALSYLEWSGLVRIGLPSAGGLGAALLGGVGVELLTSEKLTIDGGPQSGTSDPSTLNGFDLTVILGASLDLGGGDGRWFLDARFSKSLMGVADPLEFLYTDTPNLRHRTVSIAIGRAWGVL